MLVDTTTDLRAQALRFRVTRVDAILFTHSHADHVMGLDEIRRFNAIQRTRIPCFADARTASEIRHTFGYIFETDTAGRRAPGDRPVHGGRRVLSGPDGSHAGAVVARPAAVLGYRIGPFAYLTDCSAVPDDSWALLAGVDLLVVDALRHRPHPTHFTVAQALAVVDRLRPSGAWFTHIAHDLPHAATCAELPAGVELAYDGLTLEFDL